ncbi:E3 ubiquitin-protein ligase RNF220-like isoform X5 [Acipenser ruthenus]|uniref:E3 ubiquitin-protein ligase RNF220-like isoform X5 n=1 Tax=Acipenser ruthenus TaxID=7906 RepID=UPI00145B3C08|nr:E3 ubiquitin-protein ligase RNF220-like isoform X5 [Acipenser ruthenus]
MDLHRAAFKMESSSYLPNPLASPALMVLASTAEASRDASIPCQQPRPFGVPVSMDKEVHIPFTNGSYTFASMYHRQGAVPGGFPSRDFPPSLLHLHHQFAPPNLDCSPISMLNHSGVGAFRPFASVPDDRDGSGYQSAFTPAKRLKGCLEADASPHLRYSDSDGKEYDYGGAQISSSSPGSLKAAEDAGKKLFVVSGLLSDRDTSSSPEDRHERCKKKASLYDSQAPICPICQVLLRPGELQDHMEQEMNRLTQLHLSKNPALKDSITPNTPKSILLSVHIKREGESPTASPLSSEDTHHSDRYQTFLRVRANRQTRLNARIGKMKRRKPEDGQREGACGMEDDSVDIDGENGNRFEEYEWCGQKRVRATSLLEGGFGGTGFVTCSTKENHDSDADLDVDGDDTLEYGKAQYTEADVIPCSGEEPGEAKEREALRGAVLNGGTPSTRITPEFSKWASDEMPSTSNGESSKQEAASTAQKTCKNSDIDKITEDSTVTTLEALKARIRELERQLARGDRYKCLICMRKKFLTSAEDKNMEPESNKSDSRGAKKLPLSIYCLYRGYIMGCSGVKRVSPPMRDSFTMPLTSIQCWHVHCEECWLRTLGAKKLCPQCNTITSPGDLRRVYL